MSRVRRLLNWEYGFRPRHLLLGLAIVIGWIDLYMANLTGSVPSLLALAAAGAPFVGAGAVIRASADERATIAAWSFLAAIGSGVLNLSIHLLVGYPLPFNQFQNAHPIGLILTALTAVAWVLFGTTLFIGVANVLWHRQGGGTGGATPEERVLSEEEYSEFEPIRKNSDFLQKILESDWPELSAL